MVNPHDRAVLRDRILIVENDPVISDLIGRQALQGVGYQVQFASDATTAIARALQWAPDLILIDLNLPGLSGKDLMIALASQGVQTPVIILAQRGAEADIIQTFRLGAADYLLLPAREAEVVNAVSRVLQQVHDRRERERLAQQLQQANQDLQQRVRELTTIFALGKAMTSITDQAILMERMLDGALRITQADLGWFLLRDSPDRPFVLVAERNLPASLSAHIHQSWDDGISSLVAMSGETLSIHGDPLRRFKIAMLGLSALVVPVKAQKTVVGLLVMMRKAATPFGASEQHLLGALADYASISLVNARLFRALEDRARLNQRAADSALINGKVNDEILRVVKKELAGPVAQSLSAIEQVLKDPTARLRPEQRQHLATVQDHLLHIHQISQAILPLQATKAQAERARIDLAALIRDTHQRLQTYAQRGGLTLTCELPSEAVYVIANAGLIGQALVGLISNAIKYSRAGAQVLVRLETADQKARVLIHSTGRVVDPKDAEKVFDKKEIQAASTELTRFGGLGIRLSLVKEIITRHDGKVWLESQPEKAITNFYFILPLDR